MRTRRLLAPALLATGLVAGCVAFASDGWDVLELVDGGTLRGHIVEAVGGTYWVELPSGELTQVPYAEVARVTRATATDPVPLPNYRHPSASVAEEIDGGNVFHGGLDAGSTLGVRMRWDVRSRAVHSIDGRFDIGVFLSPWVMPVFFHGVGVNFLGNGRVHPQLSINGGLAFPSSLYGFVGLGGGITYDPPSPFEMHLGGIVSIAGSYLGVVPDFRAGWVW